ncbi:MAG: DUF4386 domain-containing protein [Dokdonella sp.]
MTSPKTTGRTIGVLLLVQMICGPLVNFVLLGVLSKDPPGFLVAAAANARQISLGALVGLGMGVLSLAIAIVAWPMVRRCNERMALGLLALAIIGVALSGVEQSAVLSMLSLSQAYSKATGDAAMFQALALTVGAARTWAHTMHLLVEGGVIFVLYGVFYRYALIPRAWAAFGMVAATLLISAVAMSVFGHAFEFPLLMPLGSSQLALVVWLMVKGLAEPRQPLHVGAPSAA